MDNTSNEFVLRGCPAGYSITSQQCEVCPAAFYCTGNSVPSRPCASGSFSPPGANSSSACVPSVFVTVAVNLQIKRPEFRDLQSLEFQKALSKFTQWDPGYVTIKLIQSGENPETTTVTFDLVAADAQKAAALVKRVKSEMLSIRSAFSIGQYHGVIFISVQETSCIPGYELVSQTCQSCPATYFCAGGALGREACPTDRSFSFSGANSTASCRPAVFVRLVFSIPIFKENLTDSIKLQIILAVSIAASIPRERVVVSFGSAIRRADDPGSVTITAEIAADDAASAAQIKNNIDQQNLNEQLLAQGLPQGTLMAVTLPETTTNSPGLNLSAVIGVSVSAIVLLVALSAGGFRLYMVIRKQHEHMEFRAALSSANSGDTATDKHLPPDLRKFYIPERVLSNCMHGLVCVVQAKQKNTDTPVAIKLVTPSGKSFQEGEVEQLRREGRALALFSERKCEFTARLLLASGPGLVSISSHFGCYVMDLLKGERMDIIIHSGEGAGSPANCVECIHAARDVLAALKVMHGEGMLHLNIQPSNIFCCKAVSTRQEAGDNKGQCGKFKYKLLGFGSVQCTGDASANQKLACSASTQFVDSATLPYTSPEMLKGPRNATFQADIWSLGITMFEIVTRTLPFQVESSLNLADLLSGNIDEKAPSVLERTNAGEHSELERSLALVISKAMEKMPINRYSSADAMHGAVFWCLVSYCSAYFSIYLSYQRESDAPLAKLLFDELNHSFTPGGHRVTVYLDSHVGHDQVENWEDDIARGLLHSICFAPILSYKEIAPLAALTKGTSTQLSRENAPPVLGQLVGAEQDRDDAILVEILIADALLKRKSAAKDQLDGEKGQLREVVPIFAERQQPQDREYLQIILMAMGNILSCLLPGSTRQLLGS